MFAHSAVGAHYSSRPPTYAIHLRHVLAFDRIGSRIPQLVQIWLTELFFAMPLTFLIAKLIDISVRGGFGVPGTGGVTTRRLEFNTVPEPITGGPRANRPPAA